MLRLLFFTIIVTLCILQSHAQIDTSFTIVRKNVPAKFSFTKYTKGTPFRGTVTYTIEKAQIHRLNMLLRSFVKSEAGYDSLMETYHHLDSIFNSKELQYTEMMKTQELRSKNYEEAYQSLLTINTRLDKQVKDCKDLALAEHRKGKKNITLIGALALSVGLIIGLIIP